MPERSGRSLIVFTDLDATLLDQETYDFGPAAAALAECRRRDVPVVLASSKTRAELVSLHGKLGLADPFVAENGGGIFFVRDEPEPPPAAVFDLGLWKWSLGRPYPEIRAGLRRLERELGYCLRGFGDMDVSKIAARTGLSLEEARMAAQREFGEPFLVLAPPRPDAEAMLAAAGRQGLDLTQGGRFWHLQGRHDKAGAARRLLEWYRRFRPELESVGLGDSPNDFELLKTVDHPVLVRGERDFPGLEQDIPGLKRTILHGPAGWNQAVLDMLGEVLGA